MGHMTRSHKHMGVWVIRILRYGRMEWYTHAECRSKESLAWHMKEAARWYPESEGYSFKTEFLPNTD